MHYGAEDEEYLFDSELYCGLCAQQMPRDQAAWSVAFRQMSPDMVSYVEEELNKIAVSKSGLQPELLAQMGEAIAALGELRELGGPGYGPRTEAEYMRWVDFACTYYMPNVR
jgi:hypothetical protein